MLDAEVTNSILGDGCVVRGGTTIKHSVIGLRSLIGENCHIEDALIMGCGLYDVVAGQMASLGAAKASRQSLSRAIAQAPQCWFVQFCERYHGKHPPVWRQCGGRGKLPCMTPG